MNREKYTIYQDSEQKIEIYDWVHQYLKSLKVSFIELKNPTKDLITGLILYDLEKKKLLNKNTKIKISSIIPILIPNDFSISMSEPFDIFDLGLRSVSCLLPFNSNKEEIKRTITDLYLSTGGGRNMICEIFEEKIQEVQGYFVDLDENNITILLWSYDSN